MVKKQRRVVSVKPDDRLEKVLIENFVSLQKVMVNLSSKLDGLAEKISRLLNLFEASAKSFMEKEGGNERGVSQKIDSLLEQNKILAKGIAMVYEKPFSSASQPSPTQSALNQESTNLEGYQHSLQLGESANVSSQGSRFKSLPKRENA